MAENRPQIPEAAATTGDLHLCGNFFSSLLEAGERYAYVGLHGEPSDEYAKRAIIMLSDCGNALRSYAREQAFATLLYCRVLKYDVGLAGSAMLGLAEAARGEFSFSERTRRLTLHALFVSLGATHHLTDDEIAAARKEIAQWYDGQKNLTVSQYNNGP